MARTVSGAARRLWACALAALALGGCGGGDSESTFSPRRLLVFGDEASVITARGAKYTVNAVDSEDALSCSDNPIWVQVLARNYGIVFAQCNPDGDTIAGTIYAAAGAKVADIAEQVAQHGFSSGFVSTDLVTVYVGTQDVLALYADSVTTGSAAALVAAREAGAALAGEVNTIALAGGKVLVVTLPNLGSSPYARDINTTDGSRETLITQLVDAFNAGLRATLINDGHMIGLVLLDETVQAVLNSPATFGYSDVSTAACTVALPNCTTSTLVTDATISSHLWADYTHFNAGMHASLGSLAVTRATNNPF